MSRAGREVDPEQWRLKVTATARRQVAKRLPPAAAAAAVEFCHGPLLTNPRRVGKRLLYPPYDGMYSARRGDYRVIYAIDDDDRTITVHAIAHRADSYRGR